MMIIFSNIPDFAGRLGGQLAQTAVLLDRIAVIEMFDETYCVIGSRRVLDDSSAAGARRCC